MSKGRAKDYLTVTVHALTWEKNVAGILMFSCAYDCGNRTWMKLKYFLFVRVFWHYLWPPCFCDLDAWGKNDQYFDAVRKYFHARPVFRQDIDDNPARYASVDGFLKGKNEPVPGTRL